MNQILCGYSTAVFRYVASQFTVWFRSVALHCMPQIQLSQMPHRILPNTLFAVCKIVEGNCSLQQLSRFQAGAETYWMFLVAMISKRGVQRINEGKHYWHVFFSIKLYLHSRSGKRSIHPKRHIVIQANKEKHNLALYRSNLIRHVHSLMKGLCSKIYYIHVHLGEGTLLPYMLQVLGSSCLLGESYLYFYTIHTCWSPIWAINQVMLVLCINVLYFTSLLLYTLLLQCRCRAVVFINIRYKQIL